MKPADQQRLNEFYKQVQHLAEECVGFPWNSQFDYSALFDFLKFPLNNDGDPFLKSPYHLNTHDFEREVIHEFAELTEIKKDDYWGYVTGGGTEGNLYGAFLARELYPEGVFYCSEETFSFRKLIRCLHLENVIVKSLPDGRIDVSELKNAIRSNGNRTPIVLANVGTTLKGAVDDLDDIHGVMSELPVENYYIHADAALAGMILPFVDNPPPWNFSTGVDSLSISLHKMIGSPIPCGVVLAKKSEVDRVATRDGQIGRFDTTILASRNAITPLFLWYAFRTIGRDGFRATIAECLKVADYAVERLKDTGRDAWRKQYSNTVVFARPSDQIVHKWQLYTHGDLAHIITMPQVTRDRIDKFISEISTESSSK